MFPEFALIEGEKFKINTDYKVALKCFDIIEDETITNQERALAVIYLLFGFIPEHNINVFLEKAKYFLQCGETEEEQITKKKDMDFKQDEKYIYSSFMSDYHIDLYKSNMHFWEFIYLIQGLTENSSLNRVREIRNYDLSTIKDAKERKKMIEAKKQVALKRNKTLEELKAEEIFRNQLKGC